jgi:hypothetical protein
MGFFGFVFWMMVLWLAFRMWCRWQRRHWVVAGPHGYGPVSGWYDSSEFQVSRKAEIQKRRERLEAQQEYIDALESRVSDLEERLDFTERLLASRRESATSDASQVSP